MSPHRLPDFDSGIFEMWVRVCVKMHELEPLAEIAHVLFSGLVLEYGWSGVVCIERTPSAHLVRLFLGEKRSRTFRVPR